MLAIQSPVSNLYDRPVVYALFMMPVLLTLGSVWRKTPAAPADRPCTRTLSRTQQLGVFFAGDSFAMSSRQGPRSAEHVAALEKLADALLATVTMEKRGPFGAAPSAQ
jgi:hypothetical protein